MALGAALGRRLVALAMLVTPPGALAEPHLPAGQPESPSVDPEGRVTFRLYAPAATKALVVLEGSSPREMSASEAGVWSYTTEPLAPDLYSYFFVVDGLPRSDAANALAKPVVTGGHHSMVHVPGPPSLVWEVGEVPRGTVHRHSYRSAAIGEEREYFVYTPPGYDPAAGRTYPVLYLLHGVTDDASAWRTAGRADVILDNLIARGQAEPMLLVLPLGYGFADPDKRLWEVINNIPEHLRSLDVLAGSFVDELLPRVEAEYRVAPGRESRAIAGLSMGGSQALHVGLGHLDRFAWIGSFSGALTMFAQGYDRAFSGLDRAAAERLRLLWIACGAEDFLIEPNRQFRDWLAERELPHVWSEMPGGHTWMVFRRSLIEFAPLLFRAADRGPETGGTDGSSS